MPDERRDDGATEWGLVLDSRPRAAVRGSPDDRAVRTAWDAGRDEAAWSRDDRVELLGRGEGPRLPAGSICRPPDPRARIAVLADHGADADETPAPARERVDVTAIKRLPVDQPPRRAVGRDPHPRAWADRSRGCERERPDPASGCHGRDGGMPRSRDPASRIQLRPRQPRGV